MWNIHPRSVILTNTLDTNTMYQQEDNFVPRSFGAAFQFWESEIPKACWIYWLDNGYPEMTTIGCSQSAQRVHLSQQTSLPSTNVLECVVLLSCTLAELSIEGDWLSVGLGVLLLVNKVSHPALPGFCMLLWRSSAEASPRAFISSYRSIDLPIFLNIEWYDMYLW